MRVIGIDPSMNNTALAIIYDANVIGGTTINTKHIKSLDAGVYTQTIRELVDPDNWLGLLTNPGSVPIPAGHVTAGFVEDFSNMGRDTTRNAIVSVSRSGGMAEEALAGHGISMLPVKVRDWRNWAIGRPDPHPTKSGRLVRYWTKGDKKKGVPGNVAPGLLRLFNDRWQLHEKADYDKLFHNDPKYKHAHSLTPFTWEQILDYISKTIPSSRRIQLVFGISLDELEAAGIALAGYKMIKANHIEGITYDPDN